MARTAKMTQQERAERTRARLLEAARRVFADSGYAGATVDDVARAAGMSKGALYFHFSSKEDVLLALIDGWARAWSGRLEEACRNRLPGAAVTALLRALLHPGEADRCEGRLVLEFQAQAALNPKVRLALMTARRRWRDLLAAVFSRAQEASMLAWQGSPETAADTVLALHDGLAVQASLGPAADIARAGAADAALGLLARPHELRPAG